MKKGDLELGEIIVVLLLLVGVMTGSMYLGVMAKAQIPQDNRTMSEMMKEGRMSLDDSFYSEITDGNYKILSYEWMIGNLNETPDRIELGKEKRMISEILFNGTYVESLRGFTFKSYVPTAIDKQPRVKAFGIFINETNVFDRYLEDGNTFSFEYFPYPVDRKKAEGCKVVSAKMYRTANDTIFKTYTFDCDYLWSG